MPMYFKHAHAQNTRNLDTHLLALVDWVDCYFKSSFHRSLSNSFAEEMNVKRFIKEGSKEEVMGTDKNNLK